MNKLTKNIFVAIGVLLLVASFYFVSNVWFYIIVASIISLIGQPLVEWYSRIKIFKWRLNRAVAAGFTLLTIYLIFALIIAFFIPLVIDEARMLSNIDLNKISISLDQYLKNAERVYHQFYPNEHQSFRDFLQSKALVLVNEAKFDQFFSSFTNMIGNFFVAIFSITFISFFFLKESGLSHSIILTLVPSQYESEVRRILTETNKMLARYFIGLCIDMGVVSLLVSIGLFALGIHNALIIGLLAGLLNIIPYVGPWIAAAIGILIGVSANLDLDLYTGILPLMLQMLSVFIAVQLVDAFLIQPFIFSNTVKAHPLEIFIVTMTAGTLAGISGMIVAIPTYTILRIIAREFLVNFKLIDKLTKGL